MPATIYGVVDADVKLKKMLAVKEACEGASVDYPQEVKDYLGDYIGETPETILIERLDVNLTDIVTEAEDRTGETYVFRVADVPEEIKVIKVCVYC